MVQGVDTKVGKDGMFQEPNRCIKLDATIRFPTIRAQVITLGMMTKFEVEKFDKRNYFSL